MCTEKKCYMCFSCNGNIVKFIDNGVVSYMDEHADGCPMSEVTDKTDEFYEKLITKSETKADLRADIESTIKIIIKKEADVDLTIENSKDLFKLVTDDLTWIEIIMEIETAYGIGIDEHKIGFNFDDVHKKLSLYKLVNHVESKLNQD